MRLVPVMIIALTAGCSKVATVPVNLSAAQGSATTAVAQTIELKHEEDGWVKVKTTMGDAKLDKMADGKSVQVAMDEVPKGKYTAVRATFMVPGKETTKGFGKERASGNNNSGMVEAVVTTQTEFCAKGKKDNDLTIIVRQNEAQSEPTIKVGQHPACK